MSPDLDSLTLLITAVLDTCPWEDDFEVIELPWMAEKFQRVLSRSCGKNKESPKLAFGMMKCDGNVSPHPPIQRAMNLVADSLLARGYEVGRFGHTFRTVLMAIPGH